MDYIEKNTKILAIGEDGINNLKSIESEIKDNMYIEELKEDQDIDKEYIRSIFDGIEVLFLIYSSKDKRIKDIVRAISIMATERRVISIGINTCEDDKKEDLGLNREFELKSEELIDFTKIMNLIIDSISENTLLYLDTTDLKEVIANEKGIGYSYVEFNAEELLDVANRIKENMKYIKEENLHKKSILMIEGAINLEKVNELAELLKEDSDSRFDVIYSLNSKENNGLVKTLFIHN